MYYARALQKKKIEIIREEKNLDQLITHVLREL